MSILAGKLLSARYPLNPLGFLRSRKVNPKAISLQNGGDSYDDYSFDPWLDWLKRLLSAGVDLAVFTSLKDTNDVEIDHIELSLSFTH